MDNQILMVIGGARSGKSEFAEKLMARTAGRRKGYIATSQVLDDEMKYRVMVHQQRRPAEWETFEVLHEAGPMMAHILERTDALLFDCITMYVNNILMAHLDFHHTETLGVSDLENLRSVLQQDLDQVFGEISAHKGKEIIFVSDELGMGIVPGNAVSRVYRDLMGLANQYIASHAQSVYLSVAGITIDLKRSEVHLS